MPDPISDDQGPPKKKRGGRATKPAVQPTGEAAQPRTSAPSRLRVFGKQAMAVIGTLGVIAGTVVAFIKIYQAVFPPLEKRASLSMAYGGSIHAMYTVKSDSIKIAVEGNSVRDPYDVCLSLVNDGDHRIDWADVEKAVTVSTPGRKIVAAGLLETRPLNESAKVRFDKEKAWVEFSFMNSHDRIHFHVWTEGRPGLPVITGRVKNVREILLRDQRAVDIPFRESLSLWFLSTFLKSLAAIGAFRGGRWGILAATEAWKISRGKPVVGRAVSLFRAIAIPVLIVAGASLFLASLYIIESDKVRFYWNLPM